MTTSVFFTNLLWVLLLANWVIEWNWREKFSNFKQNHLLQAFLVLGAVHLLWLIGTENLSYGLFDMQKKLPLIAIPLVVLTTKPLSRKELLPVGFAYVTTIFVMSIVGLVRYLTMPDLPYRNLVPHISHIRFGLNICLTHVLLIYAAFKHRRLWLYIINLLLSAWFIVFLLMLHAYTAFIILLITAVVLLIAYRRHLSRTPRIIATATVAAVLLFTVGLTCIYHHDYYHLQQICTQPLPSSTANGNPYQHLDDGLIENGNYVHQYVCEKEMRREWPKYSNLPFDSITPNGYSIYPTLLRYLNGMGLTKDSLGMTHLQPCDIAAIEILVKEVPLPILNFEYSPQYIDTETPVVNFTDNSQYSDHSQWLFGDGAVSTGKNVTHHFDIYATNCNAVTLRSFNELGCFVDTTWTIVIDTFGFFRPNIFTPNKATNNVFSIISKSNMEKFHIAIFNRRGALVFTSDDINFKWDGTHNGTPCPQGAYPYVITYTRQGSIQEYRVKGTITLIR